MAEPTVKHPTPLLLRSIRHLIGLAFVSAINPYVLFATDQDARTAFWLQTFLGATLIPLIIYVGHWVFFTRHAKKASPTPVFVFAWVLLFLLLASPWARFFESRSHAGLAPPAIPVTSKPQPTPASTRSTSDLDRMFVGLPRMPDVSTDSPPSSNDMSFADMVAAFAPAPAPASAPASLATGAGSQTHTPRAYARPEKRRWSESCDSSEVATVSSNGQIVRLDDGSVWFVDPADAIDSHLWLPGDTVSICAFGLLHHDDGEVVGATPVR